MQRREFLRKSGGMSAVLGSGILGHKLLQSNSPRTITIRLHQEEKISQYLDKVRRDKEVLLNKLKETLPEVLDSVFPELTIEISTGRTDISLSQRFNTLQNFGITRTTKLSSWAIKSELSEKIETVRGSNVVLCPMPPDDWFDFAGHGIQEFFPPCCSIHNNYAVVWMSTRIMFQDLAYATAHEIGHNIGLNHSYGTNISQDGEEYNSIMLSPAYPQNHELASCI